MTSEATAQTGTDLGDLAEALRGVIRSEVAAACSNLPQGGGGGGGSVAISAALIDQVVNSEKLTQHINTCLEQGLRNVLPQFIGRLKQELGESAAAAAGGGVDGNAVRTVVNSNEMKEMLEDQFRTMMLYLKQEVLPKEIKKVTG